MAPLFLLLGALSTPAGNPARVQAALRQLPLQFEQGDTRTPFIVRQSGATMLLHADGIDLLLARQRRVVRLKFAGADPAVKMRGEQELPGKHHYFIGNKPEEWRSNVPTFAQVRYENLYPGVDLLYYGNGTALEYDFVVAPGADPSSNTVTIAVQ